MFFIGFCAVIPIDSISQASKSSKNYAQNTFVVVGALLLFGITALVISLSRLYVLRSAMSDIPKRYVPLDNGDMSKPCLRMINENFKKCEKIKDLSLRSTRNVNHPGLSNPHGDELPPLLPFEDVVKAIGMKLKWSHKLDGTDLALPANHSFRELIALLETRLISTGEELNREYVDLYEEFRYSGELITKEKFLRFMELSVYFVKETRLNMSDEHRRPSTAGNYSSDFESMIDRVSNYSSRYERSTGGLGLISDSYVSNYDWPKEDDVLESEHNNSIVTKSGRYGDASLSTGLERVSTMASLETTGTTRYK